MNKRLDRIASKAIQDMHQFNSDVALQSSIELMLTDRKTDEVIMALHAWADYLEERK